LAEAGNLLSCNRSDFDSAPVERQQNHA